ncbi:hypothetical protein BpHYR1_023954 [Brachionus plicatilis]|uniref:Uncharacterized protein n=1 Tax=Brachionus plicatilis TaxID=10195 RepID=A0A3M7SPJ2_BRAPC|nr:hypothetical protein BpHYR1_023954 [Brachionus plicatilis]
MCRIKFEHPVLTRSKFSLQYSAGIGVPGSTLGPPPCSFKARMVATKTTQLGTKLEFLHFMLKNFSIPISAPKPASSQKYFSLWLKILKILLKFYSEKIRTTKLYFLRSNEKILAKLKIVFLIIKKILYQSQELVFIGDDYFVSKQCVSDFEDLTSFSNRVKLVKENFFQIRKINSNT